MSCYQKVWVDEENRRKSLSMLSSLGLHILLFILLHLAGRGIGMVKKPGDFDLHAIKVMNMIAKAKDPFSARAKTPVKKLKAARRSIAPKAKVKSVPKHKPSPKVEMPKPTFQQPDLPKYEVAERTLERQQFTVAKLDIPKKTKITAKKVFAEEPKKVIVPKEKPRKKIKPVKEIKKPNKRLLKTPTLIKEKAPNKKINLLAELNPSAALEQVVQKKSIIPKEEKKILPTLKELTPNKLPTPTKKAQEKKKTTQIKVASLKATYKRETPLYTPQNITTRTQKKKIKPVRKPKKRVAPTKTITPPVKPEEAPKVEVKLPATKETSEPLYKLEGNVDKDVKNAFLTVNDVTQILPVVNGKFVAEIAMVKGNNKVEVLVFSSRGGIGKSAFNLLFSPLKGAPMVMLESPVNGMVGGEGDAVMVTGTVDDPDIQRVTLILNDILLPPIKVINGVFEHKVFLPPTRTTTFRVMAKSRSGLVGYSAKHTVVSDSGIDLANPRPY